jgi:hypothetical protein
MQPPIIVNLTESSKDPTSLADVVLGSIGLAGAILLIAVICGVFVAGVLFWLRSRSA